MGDITGLTSQFIEKLRQAAVDHNLIILVVNNIVINNSTYTKNFKDSISKKNTGQASYKPSLGKLFSDAANVRLRMEYTTSVDGDKKFLYKQKYINRKIMIEKDISG